MGQIQESRIRNVRDSEKFMRNAFHGAMWVLEDHGSEKFNDGAFNK